MSVQVFNHVIRLLVSKLLTLKDFGYLTGNFIAFISSLFRFYGPQLYYFGLS